MVYAPSNSGLVSQALREKLARVDEDHAAKVEADAAALRRNLESQDRAQARQWKRTIEKFRLQS